MKVYVATLFRTYDWGVGPQAVFSSEEGADEWAKAALALEDYYDSFELRPICVDDPDGA